MGILKQRRFQIGAALLILVLLFAGIFLLTRPDPDPFDGAAVVDPPFKSLTYGIQAFMWWEENVEGLHLDWVKILMFTHVKQVFPWKDIEIEPGEWHWSSPDRILEEIEKRDLNLVVRLAESPDWAHPSIQGDVIDAPPDAEYMAEWANFCGTVATRYKGRIAAYQIWNEPNLRREWGDRPPNAAEYVELLKPCSEAIRAADPDAILISAGLAPNGQDNADAQRDDVYLDRMYLAGFQEYIDVVGVHAPGFAEPEYGPDDAERDGMGRWASFRRIEDLRKIMLLHDDAARQVAILELGWTTDPLHPDYSWYAVDNKTQAEYLSRAYQYAAEHWRPWVGLMSTIYIAKPDWTEEDEEYWWAITTPENYTRPAFGSLARMPKYCDDIVVPARNHEETSHAPDVNPCN